MTSLTARKLVEDIRVMVDDIVDYNVASNDLIDGNTYSTQMVLDSINYAIKEYCKRSNASFTFTTSVIPATGLIPTPSDYLEVKQVSIGGKFLEKSSWAFESMKDYDWDSETGTEARRWLLQDYLTIKMVPIVSDWSLGLTSARVGYLQAPKSVTTINTVTAGSFTTDKWYQIVSVGDTSFTGIGASANTVGIQFKATGVGSGTGTAYEIVDPRVIETHQDFLKYAAAYFLFTFNGTPDFVNKADKYISIFRALTTTGV